MGAEPLPRWVDDCCAVCPAQILGPGGFDVVARPFHGQTFVDGVRVDGATGVPTCVHPFRVGLPVGAYASQRQSVPEPALSQGEESREVFIPAPDQLELPEQPEDLEAWMIAVLRTASDRQMASALDQAETTVAGLRRFSGEQIVEALRRVLAR